MPARHGDYSGGRREEMIAANRTIALSSPREAFVRGCMRDGYANIAALAVIEIFTQAFSSSADATVWAVVDLLLAIVVPELANVTVVTCGLSLTVLADIGCWLRGAARHAQHVLCHLPVQVVVFSGIVAVPTRVPAATLKALYFDIALVVLATKNEFSFGSVVIVVFAVLCTGVVVMRSIRRVRVALSKIVRDVGGDVGCRRRRVRRRGMDVGEEGLSGGRGKRAVV